MNNLDILVDAYLENLAARLNFHAQSHKRASHRVGGGYTETDVTWITQRKIHSRQNRTPQSGQGMERNWI
jgi:hypothetical protein